APRPLPSLLGPCRADRVANLAWPRSRLPPPSLPEELMKAHQPDPCGQIQADLSAMLDGELDAPSVRRVMIHSDACPNCRAFLEGIRLQARAHRQLHAVLVAPGDHTIEVPAESGG